MRSYYLTDPGKVRDHNEDSVIIVKNNEGNYLMAIADGMGGHSAGEVASSIAISYLGKHFKETFINMTKVNAVNWIRDAVDEINTLIFQHEKTHPESKGMGTTLVVATLEKGILYVANVGDSRLYLINDNDIRQITRDHSYVQTLIDLAQITPEEASFNPHKNVITRAIGTQKTVEADIICYNLSDIDAEYILLCSDGLTNYADNKTIHSIITESDSIENACKVLIDKANENGGGDNITAVIIKLDKNTNKQNVDDCEGEECAKRGEF